MATSEMERMNRRMKRRRRRRLLGFALLSPFLILLCVWGINAILRVEVIAVQNDSVYDTTELLQACDLQIGDGLFSVKTDKLSSNLPQTYPYIDHISFRLSVPNKIYIRTTACEPAFMVQSDQTWLLLDRDLKVLEVSDTKFDTDVLNVLGMTVVSYTVGQILDSDENIEADSVRSLIGYLEQYGLLAKTDEINMDRKYDLTLRYNGVILVELGNFDDLDKKVEKFYEILRRNDPNIPAEITVSYYKQGRYRQITE